MTSTKVLALMHLDMFITCSFIRLFLHFIHSYAEEPSVDLSQFMLLLQRFCMICQPFNKNGTPRGSYTLLKAATKTRLTDGL